MMQPNINYADRMLIRNRHLTIVSPSNGSSSPGQEVTPVAFGSVLGLEFTTTAKDVYVEFKIPRYYAGISAHGSSLPAASFHLHWTKSADAAEDGNTVTWEVAYTVFNGISDSVNTITRALTITDTYESNTSDGTRNAYRAGNLDVSADFVAGYYAGIRVKYTATTFSTSNPVLISCDLILAEYCNKA